MKVLGVIPARYSSTRFPGKPLIDLKGKTMIERVYLGAQKCSLLDKVIVATDDDRIIQKVRSFGGEVEMTSVHHNSGTERCIEVLEKYSAFDVVVNIQGDEPLINPAHLEKLIRLFEKDEVEIATLVTSFNSIQEIQNKNRIKVVLDHFGRSMYFSRSVIPFQEKERMDLKNYLKHIGVYGFRTKTLLGLAKDASCDLEQEESLEQLRWLYRGHRIYTDFVDDPTPNIDTPEDVELVLDFLKD